jgi:hypothetical protein
MMNFIFKLNQFQFSTVDIPVKVGIDANLDLVEESISNKLSSSKLQYSKRRHLPWRFAIIWDMI